MIVMCVIIIFVVGIVSIYLALTFSIGKSRRGDEMAAAAASWARDLPDNVEKKKKKRKKKMERRKNTLQLEIYDFFQNDNFKNEEI